MINRSLLALACGDSYGSHYEMMGLMGNSFDREELPDVPVEITITDDTKMATILLKHYMHTKGLNPSILLKNYQQWAIREGDQDGIGIQTKNILVHASKNKDSQGNGALMRNIPFGCQLIKDGYSFEDAVNMMNKESALTHANETIFQANCLALDLAINGLSALTKETHKPLLSRLKFGKTAWVTYSLYIVIEALKQDLSFIDGFKYIVSCGGDTDTNCAIFGAIKGNREDISNSLPIEFFLTKKIEKYLNI